MMVYGALKDVLSTTAVHLGCVRELTEAFLSREKLPVVLAATI
jgi:hypothetical protein